MYSDPGRRVVQSAHPDQDANCSYPYLSTHIYSYLPIRIHLYIYAYAEPKLCVFQSAQPDQDAIHSNVYKSAHIYVNLSICIYLGMGWLR